MTERYILAIDGGATKTALSIRSESGQSIFDKVSTSSNYQAIGKEKVEQVFKSLLFNAYESTNIQEIEVAVFAIAGIDTKHDLNVVKEIVQRACEVTPINFKKIIVENDVESTLLGLSQGNACALIISGTGAICYATNGTETFRTGGWGHRAGDEGSGFWIGQQILRAIFQFEDGRRRKQTLLKDLVYKKLNISNVEQLNTWLYQPSYTNAQIASLCSVLHEAISNGDDVAIEIAKSAAEELALLAKATIQKVISNPNEPFTIYVNGGVLKNNIALYNMFRQFCLNDLPNLTFELCELQPIDYIVQRALYTMKK